LFIKLVLLSFASTILDYSIRVYLQRKYRPQEGESEQADLQTAPEQVPIVTCL